MLNEAVFVNLQRTKNQPCLLYGVYTQQLRYRLNDYDLPINKIMFAIKLILKRVLRGKIKLSNKRKADYFSEGGWVGTG